ncbi:hypothetical protein PRIPAC_73736 [Pristionchus pacificus]|nr:hypothetical protein PRIPAC_73736 [Pristionchus pacificus]
MPAYLAAVACLLSLPASAWGQWRVNQRSHSVSLLPTNSTWRLCRDHTDTERFKQLLRPILIERQVGTPQIRQVGEYLKSTMDNLGWHTEWDEFSASTPHGQKNFRNLIATSDPRAPRRLVLACHYDSKIIRGQRMIAATDSAVPCAMMLDVATTMTPYMYKRAAQNIALQLIFFDGEEAFNDWTATDSIYGSRHLAQKWESMWYPTSSKSEFELSREIDRIDVLMLLDLLGAKNPRILNAFGLGAAPLFGVLVDVEKELRGLGCHRNPPFSNVFAAPVVQAAVEDDHIPFLKRGVPILHLISVPFPSVWHTARDDERILDYPTIDYLTAIVRVFVAKYLGIAPL